MTYVLFYKQLVTFLNLAFLEITNTVSKLLNKNLPVVNELQMSIKKEDVRYDIKII